jgi:hypothetical protein
VYAGSTRGDVVREDDRMPGDEAPRDVLLAAGAWAAEQMRDEGFQWRPQQLMLRRTAGTLRQDILLEASPRNRRSGSIRVLTVLALSDSALRRWRRACPDRVTRLDDHVCGHYLGYACGDAHSRGEMDLGIPQLRDKQLTDWLSLIRDHALPWFEEAGDPDRVTGSRAADYTSSPAWIVEWLASVGRTDVVPGFVERHVQRHRGWKGAVRRGAALAADGGHPGTVADWPLELGWVAARVTADDERPVDLQTGWVS